MSDKKEKEIRQVVANPAKTKKKSEAKKLANSLIVEDSKTVFSYIVKEVLIPATKKLISDMGKSALDMFLYGDDERPRKRRDSKISYRQYYDDERSERKRNTYHSRNALDYDDIVLDSRGDAEMVLDSLDDIIRRYQFASIMDLYELVGISTDNYTLSKYGWTSLKHADIKRTRDGYLLVLPKAIPID